MGKIKPDPEIYELLLSRYGLKAQECVFVDDKKANTDAAEKLGMKTVQFRSFDQASEKLEKILDEN